MRRSAQMHRFMQACQIMATRFRPAVQSDWPLPQRKIAPRSGDVIMAGFPRLPKLSGTRLAAAGVAFAELVTVIAARHRHLPISAETDGQRPFRDRCANSAALFCYLGDPDDWTDQYDFTRQ